MHGCSETSRTHFLAEETCAIAYFAIYPTRRYVQSLPYLLTGGPVEHDAAINQDQYPVK